MGLGTNRDYKTRAKTFKVVNFIHQIKMNALMTKGVRKLEASKIAYNELMAMTWSEKMKFYNENQISL